MKQNMKKVIIGSILSVLILLMGLATWLIFRKPAETGEQVAKNRLNIEWYDENAKEFTITTREELFDLIELSYFYDFAGQTIKLGADIVVNEGNAADWQTKCPEYEWESIYGFAGTFDGQGHTISGLYSIGERYFANIARISGTNYITASLFRDTKKECVIKNFKIVNSYFESDLDHGIGSISSNGGGTFDSIYSDVIIRSQKCFVGGIIGHVTADTKITNCWFDGTMEVYGNYPRYIGGIAARIVEGANCVIEHCLVSAPMSVDTVIRANQFGGIVGQSYQSSVTISDCLMSGTVSNSSGCSGSIVGNVAPDSTMKLSNVYTCTDSNTLQVGYIESGELVGNPIVYNREQITGLGGYQWTTLDFDNYWAIVDGETPVLKSFADDAVSLEEVAKKVDTSWYNEQENTFVLKDEADFYGFAILSTEHTFEGKTIKLAADLTLNEGKASKWEKEPPSNQWIGIGSNTMKFAGTFDGQMHTISGVYSKATTKYTGLFGVTTQTAVMKRFKLVNSYFESSVSGLGSIAGQAVGIMDTIYSDAIVMNDKGCIGGMVGRVTEIKGSSLKMTNCWFDGKVINKSKDSRMSGGFAGWVVAKFDLSNCLNTGTIDVRNYNVPNDPTSEHIQPYAGGFFGYIHTGYDVTLKDSMNTGVILMNKAVTSAAGSILGYSSGTTTISNTYVTKESSKFTTRGNVKGEVIVYDEAQITGYGGYQWTGLDFDKYWAVVLDDTSVLKSFAKKVPSLAGVERKADISWYNAKASTYELYDAADLRGFALLSKTTDFKGKTVKLVNDIVLNDGDAKNWKTTAPETEWMSIGTVNTRFAGTFDGQKHTISGVYMNTDEKYTGFFSGTADEAVVKNFRLTNSYFYSTQDELGSIVGNGRGKFDSLYSNAILESSGNVVGGLIGSTSWDGGVKISNCWFDGEVTNVEKAGSYYAGILARAYQTSTITNSLNTGKISCDLAKQPRAGGIFGGIGRAGATLEMSSCLNTGEIVHGAKTREQGLLVGYANGTIHVENSYSVAQGSNVLVATKADKTYPTCGVAGSTEDAMGTAALANAAGLFVKKNSDGKYENAWVAVLGGAPLPKKLLAYATGEQFTPDVSWYDDSKEYTLTTKEQLFGLVVLSYLSELDGFAGKTIKLGADITINEGNAADWKQNAPMYTWGSIGDSTAKFKGDFDGQKHTISGIYQDTTKQCQGFIGDTEGKVLIKNFSLVNSYFNYHGSKSMSFFGAVAGRATGRLENIYSNAIVECTGSLTGGIVGSAWNESLTMINCWNAGPVSNTGGNVGGLIGYLNKACTVKNCLNTGAISTSSTGERLGIGGLFGATKLGTYVYNSLNTGAVNYEKQESSIGYGMIAGSLASGTHFIDLYTVKQEGTGVYYKDNITSGATTINSLDDITGIKALVNMPKLFAIETEDGNYENYWSIVANGTPVLKSFVKYAGEELLTIDISWYKKADETYHLKNLSDLYGFAVLACKTPFDGKTVQLDADIEVNKGKATATGWDKTKSADGSDITDGTDYLWVPIGTVSGKSVFNGKFDGQMHTISGIYLDGTSSYQGLFSGTGKDAEIRNLSLKNSYFASSAGDQLGSIAGNAMGIFDSIYSDAIVVSNGCNQTGGMIGATSTDKGVTMTNCWFDGSVTCSAKKSYFGGLIGRVANDSTITNCLNTGDVTHNGSVTTNGAGGFVGWVDKTTVDTTKLDINHSINAGTVTVSSGKYYGLFVGKGDGTVNATNSHSLNKAGYTFVYDKSNDAYETCGRYTAAQVAGLNALKDKKIGKLFTENDAKGYWSITNDGFPVLTTFEQGYGVTAQAVDTSWYDESKSEFTLMDSGDLYGLALLSQTNTFEGKEIKLGADIEVNKGKATATGWDKTKSADGSDIADGTDFLWLPIGTVSGKYVFNGKFDGQMHTISGIYLNASSSYQGMFSGTGAKAEIRNFSLKNSYFASSAGDQLGSIAGNAMGIFENIYSDAIVVSNGCNQTGGMIGATSTSKGVTMKNCWFDGSVTCNAKKSYLGGLIGRVANTSTITNCLNTGEVTHNGSVTTNGAGGFVGYVDNSSVSTTKVDINHSINAGTVTVASGKYYGLFVGYAAGTVNATNSHSLNKAGYTFVYDKSNDAYSTCGRYTAEQVAGDNALSQAKIGKLFTEDAAKGFWSTNPDGFPVLTTFVQKNTNQ